jgi:hypothetical protein
MNAEMLSYQYFLRVFYFACLDKAFILLADSLKTQSNLAKDYATLNAFCKAD